MTHLRDYQQAAVSAVFEKWTAAPSTLLVQATGTGKTVEFCEVARRAHDSGTGRVLIAVHRSELVEQIAASLRRFSNIVPDVEMANQWADGKHWGVKAPVVVASIQTLNARLSEGKRFERFSPDEFGTIIIDEAHHAVARSYRSVINHFTTKNPAIKTLGVTATPDRADELALGQVFESVAYEYEIKDAIDDGWLVPIKQRVVESRALNLAAIKTHGGDFAVGELAAVMEYEECLHSIAHPSIEIAAGLPKGTINRMLDDGRDVADALACLLGGVERIRGTLIFAASVAHAARLAEVINRYLPDAARFVCGETDKEERRASLADFASGRAPFLVNCLIATEGFDIAGVEIVVMGRPTKSRSLYAQMIGRGTRPRPGIVDGLSNRDERKAAIAASPKSTLEIIDFAGNAGRHKLVRMVDVLAGKESDAVVEAARRICEEADDVIDVEEALEQGKVLVDQAEHRRRKKLMAKATYWTSGIDPFDVLDLQAERQRGWDTSRQISDKMRGVLTRAGVDGIDAMTYTEARQMITEIFRRRDDGLCTYKQARVLTRFGEDADVSFDEASKRITMIKRNGWRALGATA